ncbi:MAG: peptide chain release factor N(5)-glutamine methyltransferase [Gammaproteobacteria bacterium]|nr:peptide chain release factor N(5)-glutamine methyltransferase [Gammaproteobacteria bacterium]
MNNIQQTLENAVIALSNSSTPQLDAEVILGHILGCDRSYWYAHPEQLITAQQLEIYQLFLKRRQQGEPIAYITEHKEFWSLDLWITKDVLIPRPETELLVEKILEHCPADKNIVLADLGTGSGAIALAIASERPHWQIYATDISNKALDVARKNAKQYQLPVQFCLGNWCEALPNIPFDIIVSNPPYIREGDPHLSQGDVAFEPRLALLSGIDGLQAYNMIIAQSRHYLKPHGALFFEIGYDQAKAVKQEMLLKGFQNPLIYRDLSGHARVVVAQISANRTT